MNTTPHSLVKQEVLDLFQAAANVNLGSAYAGAWGTVGSFETAYLGKHSHDSTSIAVGDASIFDLASLSKILATTSAVMVLFERGILDLDTPLETYLPSECSQYPHLKLLTLKQLLSHTSGLPAWKPFYEDLKTEFGSLLATESVAKRKSFFFSKVFETHPEAVAGERVVYSDLGFLIVGYLLEKISPHALPDLMKNLVWSQISGVNLHYRPVLIEPAQAIDPTVVATELCPWRGLLQGQVHDDNTWSMGGVAGHAGVFGTLNDVVAWANGLMSGKIVSQSTLRTFLSEVNLNSGVGSRRTIGFDMPSLDGSGTTGNAFSINSVGHLGFTGTSLWIDLDSGDIACLLTNRVHPSRNDLRIRNLRINFHSTVRSTP